MCLSGITRSFTCVGKPAPPIPTRPEARTARKKSSRLFTFGGSTPSNRRISPSDSIVTLCTRAPEGNVHSPMADTLPEMEAWIGALMNLSLSPIICPTETESPTLTTGVQGAPMCCCMGRMTRSGEGMRTGSISAVFLLCDTLTPPRGLRTAVSTPFIFSGFIWSTPCFQAMIYLEWEGKIRLRGGATAPYTAPVTSPVSKANSSKSGA